MTVQMEMGIRRLHTLPTLCRKVQWTSSLNASEFPLTTELVDWNGITIKYTSLRDIMPSSPTSLGSPRREPNWCSCTNISIKNPLVKQAARAYLQPMATESNKNGDFFMRCWTKLTNEGFLSASINEYVKTPIEACINFFTDCIFSKLSKAFNSVVGQLRPQLLGILGVRKQKK
eukprot:Gb_28310 [translate_table: standard]